VLVIWGDGMPQAPPEIEGEEKTAAEMYKSLHAKIRVIRDRHGISIAEAIQRFAGPAIDREYRKIVREMHSELGGES